MLTWLWCVPAGAAEPAVTVVTVAGEEWSGTLESLSENRLVLGGPPRRELDRDDLLWLRFSERPLPAPTRGPLVLLANGDRLAARPVSMDDEHLRTRWALPGPDAPLEISLETVRSAMFRLPEIPSSRERLIGRMLGRRNESDVVVLETGDRVRGDLLGIDEAQVRLAGPVGETMIDRNGVRAVGFNPALISFPEVEGRRTRVWLADGSRVTARQVQVRPDGRLAMRAVFGPSLDVPSDSVVALRFEGGRAVDLADLEPAAYRFTPWLSGRRELSRDRNVLGRPLRLRGTEFPRGLGMHSRSEVEYDLDGRYELFRALVGIDDAAEGAGSVTFAVEADGKRVFTSDPVTGSDPPLPVGPIDLTGRQRLTLIVDFGGFGDVRDYADWCDAIVVAPERAE